jgi:hypothetical protein
VKRAGCSIVARELDFNSVRPGQPGLKPRGGQSKNPSLHIPPVHVAKRALKQAAIEWLNVHHALTLWLCIEPGAGDPA